ncbi:hypothetical protein RFI_26473, partial [Reticulomyxa filosa]
MGESFPLESAVAALEHHDDNFSRALDYLIGEAMPLQNLEMNPMDFAPYERFDIEYEYEPVVDNKCNFEDEKDHKHNAGDESFPLFALVDNYSNRHNERLPAEGHLLDDEVDAQLPVGLTMQEITSRTHLQHSRQHRHRHNYYQQSNNDPASDSSDDDYIQAKLAQIPLDISNIHIGQHLSVSGNAHRNFCAFWKQHWKKLQGKTGVVRAID